MTVDIKRYAVAEEIVLLVNPLYPHVQLLQYPRKFPCIFLIINIFVLSIHIMYYIASVTSKKIPLHFKYVCFQAHVTIFSSLKYDSLVNEMIYTDSIQSLQECFDFQQCKCMQVTCMPKSMLQLIAIATICKYFYIDLDKGVDGTLGHSMLLLHHCLLSWSGVSRKLCAHLVDEGHLLQHFTEVKELSNSLISDKVLSNY